MKTAIRESSGHNQQQMQEEKNIVAEKSAQVGLNIHKQKTKVLKINAASTGQVTLGWVLLEESQSFTYLGSVVDHQDGTDSDVKARIGKARAALDSDLRLHNG